MLGETLAYEALRLCRKMEAERLVELVEVNNGLEWLLHVPDFRTLRVRIALRGLVEDLDYI